MSNLKIKQTASKVNRLTAKNKYFAKNPIANAGPSHCGVWNLAEGGMAVMIFNYCNVWQCLVLLPHEDCAGGAGNNVFMSDTCYEWVRLCWNGKNTLNRIY